jgi:hypothetical protein
MMKSASGPLRGTAGMNFFGFFLNYFPRRGRPVGGDGVYRKLKNG